MSAFEHVIIRASAGTGKTFQLSNRFLALLQAGALPEQILATTFTRKAAGEILQRVMLRLAEAGRFESSRKSLAQFLGDPDLTRDRCQDLLVRLTRSLHRLRISTLDSFFSQLAGSFSLELGLPPGWRIVEELRDAQMRSEAIEQILQGGSDVSRLLQLLTKGEAERSVSELVRSTVNALYNLYLETDEKAWQQFPNYPRLDDTKRQALTARLLQAEIPQDRRWQEARRQDHLLAEAEDWESFIQRGLGKRVLAGEDTYYNKPIPVETQEVYRQLIEHAKAVLVHQLAQQTHATYDLLHRFDAAYQRLKQESRGLRFEDITWRLAGSSVVEQVESQHYRLDSQVAHLLLDEFQDTSLLQWDVLRPLAHRITQPRGQRTFLWSGGQQSLFCVGDTKQAIYGWRGGQAEIFDRLEAELTGLQTEFLSQSFRSAPPIIETVNRAIGGLERHDNLDDLGTAVRDWVKQFTPHTTVHEQLSGYACLRTAPAAANDARQEDVTFAYAAQRVAQWVDVAPGATIGILARRNEAVAKMIFQLRRLGVSASEEGGNPTTDSAAVQSILSLLRVVEHPGDTVARYHVAHTPLGRPVGLTDYRDDEAAYAVAARVRRQLLAQGYGATITAWLQPLAEHCTRRDVNRLRQLVELAYDFQPSASLRCDEFIRHVQFQRVADPTSANVRVMTIHQAKGLQFDIVILPDLDARLKGQPDTCVVGRPSPTEPVDGVCLYRNSQIQSLLPARMQRMFEQARHREMTEALCVLYVALTRAVRTLEMVIPPSRGNEGRLPKTAAGLLRAALAGHTGPVTPETTLFSRGDPTWNLKPAAAAGAPRGAVNVAIDAAIDVAVAPTTIGRIALATAGPRSVGLARKSPSSLEGGRTVPVADLLRVDSGGALTRGTLVHACFEQIQWLDEGPPQIVLLRQMAARLDNQGIDVEQTLREFMEMLRRPQVAAALSRSFYLQPRDAGLVASLSKIQLVDRGANQPGGKSLTKLQVANELNFAVRRDDHILAGTVDRLVLLWSGDEVVAADVLDYKTDAVDAGDPRQVAAKVEHYQPQLEAYQFAVASMYHLPLSQVTTRLLFVGPGLVTAVPQTPNSPAVAGTLRGCEPIADR